MRILFFILVWVGLIIGCSPDKPQNQSRQIGKSDLLGQTNAAHDFKMAKVKPDGVSEHLTDQVSVINKSTNLVVPRRL
jgi:hypothetical protein